jgi:hypothetical protein
MGPREGPFRFGFPDIRNSMRDKIFVDVDLEKRSIWGYVEDREHSRVKTLFGKRKQSET